MNHAAGGGRRIRSMAAGCGIALGVVYVLSPIAIWFVVAMAALLAVAGRGLDVSERRWLTTVLVAAIVLRVLAVAALFLMTDHHRIPFGSFFGDEEYFIKRSIWLRNVALGIPIHAADLIYAFEDYSRTSYLYVLAFAQVLAGPSPYGVHLLGIAFTVAGATLLYRLVRPSLGRAPAAGGLLLLLFLPSMFAWSISGLKEPLFFLLTAIALIVAVKIVRGATMWRRAAAVISIVVLALILETVRQAGAVLTLGSVLLGLALAAVVPRPRLLIVCAVAVPLLAGLVLSRPAAQVKVYAALQGAARQHWGHVATPGYAYHLLDDRFYTDISEISDLDFRETGRFVVRAFARYVTVPLPWEIRSRAALAYLPEQVVWYLLVALFPAGLLFAFRRDPVLAGLLCGHAVVAAAIIALTSGNIGTVIRHRGLALPYIVWVSAVGACELLARAARPSGDAPRVSLAGPAVL